MNCWHPRSLAALFFVYILAYPFGASAVVDANSKANTSQPPDGSPWDNVGILTSGASGIYVGNGWVLTADHVGVGNLHVIGADFPADGTWYRLTNSDGTATDMVLFHLATSPALPAVTLVTNTPAALTSVDMIGCGRNAGTAQTNVGTYTGFYWSTTEFKSWGNNKVDVGGVTVINAWYGNLSVFTTDFTTRGTTGAMSDECQAASGDSGGAVFALINSKWQLVGMIDAINVLPSQPSNSSVYGNMTYAADIATYRNQLLSLMALTNSPKLSISVSGSNVTVCWPGSAAGFNLESTSALKPATWTMVSQNLLYTNGQGCAVFPANGGAKFFRLHKP